MKGKRRRGEGKGGDLDTEKKESIKQHKYYFSPVHIILSKEEGDDLPFCKLLNWASGQVKTLN